MPSPAIAPLRVGLVDDHEVIAAAVHAALRQTRELELVASAPTVDGLFGRAAGRLHLVVLDLRLADGSSPANNVERLVGAGCNVIAFTSGESPYLLRAVARTPVLGIVRKSEPLHALTNALLRAAYGQPVVTAEWASTLENDPLITDARLSRQEQRMLAMFADGNTAQTVADSAGIAVSTIEDYVRRIRAKYARAGRPAVTKVDLYKRAVEDGFLPRSQRAVTGGAAPRLPRAIPEDLPTPSTSTFIRRIAGERAEERVYRALAFAFLPGGVLFGLLAMPGAIEQHLLWPLWWTIAAMAIGVLPSIALGVCAFLVPVGMLRVLARVNIIGTLVVLASIPVVVMPVHSLTVPIWFADVSGLGIISVALAVEPWAAVLGLVAGAVLTVVDRLSLDGLPGLGPGLQTGLYVLLLTLTFVALGVSSLAAARTADAAEAAAEQATAGAAADAARERERTRINELVHDRVLATLLTAAREIPGSDGLERRDAQRALEGLQALLIDDQVPADLAGEDFLWKVQAATTALLPEALFNYELDDDAGHLPGDVADAMVDAAEEAMRNSRRHARATNRTVHVHVGHDSADIDVLDDGVGFDRVGVPPGRLGLNDSIEGRMRALPGGSALVVSQPGVGTRVSVRWSAP